jgi:hypothetical protein
MTKVIAITDLNGALLGVVRADPVDAGNGIIIQAVLRKTPEQRHHIVEVPDGLIGKPGKGVEELHRKVLQLLPSDELITRSLALRLNHAPDRWIARGEKI